MKVTKIREGIRQATPDQLRETLTKLRRQLFILHINASTAHVKDYSQFKKLRKSIARVLTDQKMRGTAVSQQVQQEDAQ